MSTKIWRLPSYPKRFLWYDAVGTLSLKYACRVSCVSPKLTSFQYLECKWKVLWKKILFAQFQKCLKVSERTALNYEFWLKSDTTIK